MNDPPVCQKQHDNKRVVNISNLCAVLNKMALRACLISGSWYCGCAGISRFSVLLFWLCAPLRFRGFPRHIRFRSYTSASWATSGSTSPSALPHCTIIIMIIIIWRHFLMCSPSQHCRCLPRYLLYLVLFFCFSMYCQWPRIELYLEKYHWGAMSGIL